MPLTFRAATESDRLWGAGVMARSEPWITLRRSAERCREVFFDPRHDVLIASRGDLALPLAFAVVDRRGFAGAPYLKSIAVEPESRGNGIGTSLLDHVEREFGAPAGNLFLCVSSFNLRARALYERSGYTVIGEIADFILPDASEWILRKRLHRAPQP